MGLPSRALDQIVITNSVIDPQQILFEDAPVPKLHRLLCGEARGIQASAGQEARDLSNRNLAISWSIASTLPYESTSRRFDMMYRTYPELVS